jgi:hypothetical protein
MRKKAFWLKLVLVTALLLCWAGAAWSIPVPNAIGDGTYHDYFGDDNTSSYGTYTNSGSLLLLEPGNNSGVFSDFEFVSAGKVEVNEANGGYELDGTEGLNMTIDDSGRTGTWEVVSPLDSLNFYAVKAGNAYAIYSLDSPDATGSWSTYDIWRSELQGTGGQGGLELSHFTGYNSSGAAPVPEPASMLLLGVGLAGIAGMTRGRLRKK